MAESKMSESEVLLLMLDISGYTKFMVATRDSMIHGQLIISQLIEALIEKADLPLQVLELEGDAVFLYAVRQPGNPVWDKFEKEFVEKLLEFIDTFFNTVQKIINSDLCPCSACRHVVNLKIKAVAHLGKALLHQVKQFQRVSGPDVIIVHRLLKNSVPSHQYILVTESAFPLVKEEYRNRFTEGSESYDEIGDIKTRVLILDEGVKDGTPQKAAAIRVYSLAWTMWLMMKALLVRLGLMKTGHFLNIPQGGTSINTQ